MLTNSDTTINTNIKEKEHHKEIWERCLSIIQDSVHSQCFKTWFKPIIPVKLEGDSLTIQVPSQFYYEWLEQHYPNLLKRALIETIGANAKLSYTIVVNDKNELTNLPAFVTPKKKTTASEVDNDSLLNQRYKFENFIEGGNNQFAKAASLAVAEAPGRTSFNPLVIYGGVGLGKTHLMQAIGNFARSESKAKRILYDPSEKFTQEFINAIQNNKSAAFSSYYRSFDLLLVDDIQFFSGKERTQEEFFHTFNTLYQTGKQIVLTSDRPPKEIKDLEERLLSRFQSGLVTDIQPPDLETRIAILQRRSEEDNINLSMEVIQFVAENVTTNVRELEGSLISLLARASLDGVEVNLELAKKVLKDIVKTSSKNLTIENIQRIVSNHFSIPDDLLRAKTRKQEVAMARQVAMYFAKELTSNSLKAIGLHFGGRDHSTVIHAYNTILQEMEANPTFRETIETIRQKIEVALV
jgi:chromosomal replication initiator protein